MTHYQISAMFDHFPLNEVLFSILGIALGLWLIVKSRRKAKSSEPRCHKCDYLLHGISSNRCPECGTIIDGSPRMRRSRVFVLGGITFMLLAVCLSISPITVWYRNVDWYKTQSTKAVIHDLRTGFYKPEPGAAASAPTPLVVPNDARPIPVPVDGLGITGSFFGPIPRTLSTYALEELQRREAAGALSAAELDEMDDIAISLMERLPEIFDLDDFPLLDRLLTRFDANKLGRDQFARLRHRLNTPLLSVPHPIFNGDPLQVRVAFASADIHEFAATIDGQPVTIALLGQSLFRSDRTKELHFDVRYKMVGNHILRMIVRIKTDSHADANGARPPKQWVFTAPIEIRPASEGPAGPGFPPESRDITFSPE